MVSIRSALTKRAAYESVPFLKSVLVFGTNTEVGQLDRAVVGQQNVAGFDVAVNDSVLVKKIQRQAGVQADVLDLRFGQ